MDEIKKDNKKKSTLQKVILGLECAIIAICMIISIIVIVKPGGISEKGGAKTTFLPVQTNSMEPTIKTGALVFTKKPKNDEILDLGTIITFVKYSNINVLDTHRIVGYRYVDSAGNFQIEYCKKGEMETYADFKEKFKEQNYEVVAYITRGDKYTVEFGDEALKDFGMTKEGSDTAVDFYDDKPCVELDNVVAIYKSHWNGVGYVITWLMKPTNFFIVIMIPLIALFLYNVYEICRYIIGQKVKKQTASAVLTNEEIARKAVEEYIRQQQQAQNANNSVKENNENIENAEAVDGGENNENEAIDSGENEEKK